MTDRRQAIMWPNAGVLSIGLLETNLSDILFEIQTFSFKNVHLEISSTKCQSCYLGLNALILIQSML